MKKNWMKLLTLALSVLMVMSLFAGCNVFGNGKDDKGRGAADQTDPTETTAAPGADLIGSWETQVDLAPYYNEAIKAVGDEALAEALTIDELIFTVCFEANDDGTCKFYVDEESTKST